MNFMDYAYIIVEPDMLLYPSYLCSWIECKRKITITNYVQAQFTVNISMVYGSACHRYMEWLIEGDAAVEN